MRRLDGSDIKAVRKQANLLQIPFAERLGVHFVTLSRYESGSWDIPLTVELALFELDRRLNAPAVLPELLAVKKVKKK